MDINTSKTIVLIECIDNVLLYQPTNIQRLLNKDHVQQLVTDQMKEYERFGCFSILQSITCADMNNKRYILDGQHRVAAFKLLKSLKYPMAQHIPLVVYKTESIQELKDYYIRINKHHPINPLEVTETWFLYGKDFCIWFKETYNVYVKNTEKTCHCPHINLKDMMNYNVFERLQVKTNFESEKSKYCLLIDTISKLNMFIANNFENIKKIQLASEFTKKLDKCYEKNREHPCFLGIWRQFEWIEICLYIIQNNTAVDVINLSLFCNTRKKIPKALRIQVWKKRNGNFFDGKCFVCDDELHSENMECGHIIPHVYNGSIELDNLEPICKTCNRDMGVMNLNVYKSIFNK
jgi:hypothetical protein